MLYVLNFYVLDSTVFCSSVLCSTGFPFYKELHFGGQRKRFLENLRFQA